MHELRTRATNRFRRHCLKIWNSRGGGFYGFVVLLTFLYLEVIDLGGDVAQLPDAHPGLGFAISWIIGNLVDAFVNSIRAAIWPLSWIGHFGIGLLSLGLLLGSYAAYRALRPAVVRWLTPSDEPAPLLDTTRA